MGELIVAEFITLDGVIQASGGAEEDTDGSSVLVPTLAQNDLVDEYFLHVYPLVLGSGKRLYSPGKRFDLTLVEASPLPTGVVFMRCLRGARTERIDHDKQR